MEELEFHHPRSPGSGKGSQLHATIYRQLPMHLAHFTQVSSHSINWTDIAGA